MADTAQAEQKGLYCSTAGSYFTDKDALADHYKSEFHRYNLKRKIANLPPVTREWFEARKEKLAATSGAAVSRVWMDPLTKKKFSSENTYNSYVSSNKYKELVRQSGQPAPQPVVTLRRAAPDAGDAQRGEPAAPGKAPFTIKAANGVYDPTRARRQDGEAGKSVEEDGEEVDDDDESGWETASDVDDADGMPSNAEAQQQDGAATQGDSAEPMWEEWDVRRSLFDGHVAASMEANLAYMWKHFGFYFPEAELLADPEGLLKYLGAKLEQGHLPLYVRGDDAGARQFPSLHAVQRHMADTGRFKMAWEDNEDEYEDFYKFDEPMEEEGAGMELAAAGARDAAPTTMTDAGYEMVVGGNADGAGGRILGHRQFARYYRQKYAAGDPRRSLAAASSVLSQYRALGIATAEQVTADVKRSQRTAQHKANRNRLRVEMNANVNRNLPRNVTY